MSLVADLQSFVFVAEAVGSYLEFYATLYGLAAGEQFFGLLWSLGLFKLVFAVVVIATGIEAAKIGGLEGGQYVVRTLWWKLAGTYIVMLMFVWPMGSLDLRTLNYDPPAQFSTVAQPDGMVTFMEALGLQTHGDRGFNIAESPAGGTLTIKTPMGVRLAMMIGHGLNRATTVILPDRLSLRLLDQGMSQLKLTDGNLRADVVKFNSQCYIPAVNKWKTWSNDQKGKRQELLALEAEWGLKDISYMGSIILMNTPGLYKPCTTPTICGSSLQATEGTRNFSYDANRDGTSMVAGVQPPARPYCNQWWRKIRDDVTVNQSTYVSSFNAIMADNGIPRLGDESDSGTYGMKDMITRAVINRSNAVALFSDDLSYYTGKTKSDSGVRGAVGKSIGKTATEFVGWLGNVVSQPYASAETLANNNLQQITQSIVLLWLYMLAPFVALFSGFNFKICATYAVLVLSVICWQMCWTITMWLDTNLLESMYPDSGALEGFVEGFGSKRILMDRVTNAMAVLAPSIWTFILTFAGWQGASALGSLTGAMGKRNEQTARQNAKAGVAVAQEAPKMVAKMLV